VQVASFKGPSAITGAIDDTIPHSPRPVGTVSESSTESWNPAENERFHREESGAGDGNRTHVSSLGRSPARSKNIKIFWVINLLDALFVSEGVLWGHYTIDSSLRIRPLLYEITKQRWSRWLSLSIATFRNQSNVFCENSLKSAHVNIALFCWAHSMQRWAWDSKRLAIYSASLDGDWVDQRHHPIRLLLPIFTKSYVDQIDFSKTDIWVERDEI